MADLATTPVATTHLKPLIYLSTVQQAAGGLPRRDWMMVASIEGIAMTGIKR